ncbi:hypothetical protein N8I77_003248 [Diaporthe amygdali]|uniref:Casein kinase substrate phosphoprotein PP28 domain-containing protein n=1 Tax=Phomopsis amygdali TaxID=1214568 RepID=A0AAD9SKY8_PHOAM|nr:hypothetical protein N8I77_003248 [Diaporthe amygdali]
MAGAPGGNSRGRGGKFKKPTRGGGKHFSRDLRPLDADGNEISMWSTDAVKKDESGSDESDEESEEESDDEGGPSNAAAQELSREDRKKEKKARKDAAIARAKAAAVQVGDLPPSDGESDEDDDMPANPNHSKAARKQLEPVNVDEAAEAVSGLSIKQPQSRREREALEAAQAQARYRKLHEEGKTDQAKADLERLAAIREKREADKARKEAERQEKEEQERAKKAEIEAKEAKKREAALGKAAPGKKGGKKSK